MGKKHRLKVGKVVAEASIRPKRSTLGRVHPLWGFPYEEEIVILYAGRAAELEFGRVDPPYGWESDYEKADKAIKGLIQFDRKKKLGLPLLERQVRPQTQAAMREWRRKLRVAPEELKPYQKKFKAEARRLVKKHRAYIEKVAQLLLERETVQGSELPEL